MTIKEAIVKAADSKKIFKTRDVLSILKNNYSRQAVSNEINNQVDQGYLMRQGKGPSTYYALASNAIFLGNAINFNLLNKGLSEHDVLMSVKSEKAFWKGVSENIHSIFAYAFSEMLNNAIDHSESEKVAIKIIRSDDYIIFEIRDTGIGVFKNIMLKRRLNSELEAIQDLLKGKTTTAPQLHSGEGIFFTSKIADEFILTSFGRKLRIDNVINDIFLEDKKPSLKGTQVSFRISLKTKKHLNDIFRHYESRPGSYAFDKTEIQVRLYETGTIYISRSQAKRLLAGLDKFKKIILDFERVPTVGQAFADEVFRVFKIQNPSIEIVPINMAEPVAFMVGRVEKP